MHLMVVSALSGQVPITKQYHTEPDCFSAAVFMQKFKTFIFMRNAVDFYLLCKDAEHFFKSSYELEEEL